MIGLIYFVFLPLTAAFLIALLGRRLKYFGDVIVVLTTFLLCLNSFSALKLTNASRVLLYKMGGWGIGLGITLVVDSLSSFMLVVVNAVSFLILLYSISYMERYTDKWKFHILTMFLLAGLNGIIVSGDLFNLYVFLELASISAYILVAFGVEAEDLEASFKYAVMGIFASILILLGIGLLYSYTSTLNMADIALMLSAKSAGTLINFVSVLFLVGFGLKAAIVPFHAWLPDAHSSSPSPVSAMLSGIFIKTLGVYALARIFFNIIGVSAQLLFILMTLGIISMVVGAFMAVAQNDIKRMLAYSTISQIGYIIFALGIGTPLAILGGLFYLLNHAFSKSLLFLNAGALEYSCGTRNLNKLGGLNSLLPVTAATSMAGSMSISGIPPFGGFWGKLVIIIAAVESGYIGFAFVAVLVSIVTLVYYLKFQTLAFFGKPNTHWDNIKGSPLTMKLAVIILAIACIVAGLVLISNFELMLKLAADVLSIGTAYKDAVLGAN